MGRSLGACQGFGTTYNYPQDPDEGSLNTEQAMRQIDPDWYGLIGIVPSGIGIANEIQISLVEQA